MPLTAHQQAILKRVPKGVPLVGVEVGVWRGDTSSALLKNRKQLKLHLVDPWRAGEPGTSWFNSGSTMPGRPQKDYDKAYWKVLSRVSEFYSRAVIHRQGSLEFGQIAADKGWTFDFVFLDGDHSYATVCKEIALFLPLIKQGGWLGGHDYGTNRNGKVKEAVTDMLGEDGHTSDIGNTWFHHVSAS